jgi:hypothetical protein
MGKAAQSEHRPFPVGKRGVGQLADGASAAACGRIAQAGRRGVCLARCRTLARSR